jgi:hypothetical protein
MPLLKDTLPVLSINPQSPILCAFVSRYVPRLVQRRVGQQL